MNVLALLSLLFLFGSPDLPPGEGKVIVQRACVGCHVLKVVTSKRASQKEWSTLVDQMISRGAEVDDDEVETLVNYLSKNFPAVEKSSKQSDDPKAQREVNVNQASAADLVSGLGISETDADSIVAYREKNGDYKTLADLVKVPGIDTKKIEDNKDRIRF